jgi:WD40 repeat protein
LYLGLAAALGTWWLWPPRPYAVLPGSDGAKHIEFSRDGTLIAGVKDDNILVWEMPTGQLGFTLQADTLPGLRGFTWFLLSPDGRYLAQRGWHEKLFDLKTGEDRPLAVADLDLVITEFSPDSKTVLMMTRDGNVCLMDLATDARWPLPLKEEPAKRLPPLVWDGPPPTEPIGPAYRFSSNGRWLAWEDAGLLRIFDVAARAERCTYSGRLRQLAFSPDDESWAVGVDHEVRLFAAPDGAERAVLRGHVSPVMFLAWSPDGKQLASVSSSEIKLWDASREQELATLMPDWPPAAVRFSPDGQFLCLVGGGFDRPNGGFFFAPGEMVSLWDLSASPPRHVVSVSGEKVVSPDDRTLAMIGDPDVPPDPWTIARRVPISTGPFGIWCEDPVFTSDGKMVVLAGHTTTVRGKLGNWLARGAADGNGYQYKWVDVDTWRVRAVLDTDAPGVLSPDGRLLATGGGDKPVQLWRVPPRRPAGLSLVLLGLSAALAPVIVRRRRGRRAENAAA